MDCFSACAQLENPSCLVTRYPIKLSPVAPSKQFQNRLLLRTRSVTAPLPSHCTSLAVTPDSPDCLQCTAVGTAYGHGAATQVLVTLAKARARSTHCLQCTAMQN